VLRMEMPLEGVGAWISVVITFTNTTPIGNFGYNRLYDVLTPSDVRIPLIRDSHRVFVFAVSNSSWTRRLVDSLLEGELWTSCLEHVRDREGRVRDLMIGAGVQELFQTHERIMNASLRAAGPAGEQLVYDWFGEMATYAWWMSEDMPAIVRRCMGQEGGDCVRIGFSEITAMRDRADERARIVDDWSRRVLIGMWNALPALSLLILLEVLVLCLDRRLPIQQLPPQEIVLKLDRPKPVRRSRTRRLAINDGE